MRLSKFALLLTCVLWPDAVGAQTADIEQIVNTMVRLCLAGGRTEAVSGRGSGGADLSLRSLDVTGKLKGEFNIERSSAEGLVEGIDNAMSQIAVDQADKVRSCLQPLRERIIDIFLPVPPRAATTNPLQPSTSTPEQGDALYETGIEKGEFEGWSLTPDWKRFNGILLND